MSFRMFSSPVLQYNRSHAEYTEIIRPRGLPPTIKDSRVAGARFYRLEDAAKKKAGEEEKKQKAMMKKYHRDQERELARKERLKEREDLMVIVEGKRNAKRKHVVDTDPTEGDAISEEPEAKKKAKGGSTKVKSCTFLLFSPSQVRLTIYLHSANNGALPRIISKPSAGNEKYVYSWLPSRETSHSTCIM